MGTFVGIFLLLFGVSILLRIFTGINLPLGRIAIGVFLVYLGIRVLTGSCWGTRMCKHEWHHSSKTEESVIFGENSFRAESDSKGKQGRQFQIIFGKGTIDLTPLAKLPVDQRPESVEINVVFGEGVVLLDPAMDVQIRANAAFGEARMPNGDMVAFGSMNQTFPKAQTDVGKNPPVRIHGNVVFGSMRFESAGPKS